MSGKPTKVKIVVTISIPAKQFRTGAQASTVLTVTTYVPGPIYRNVVVLRQSTGPFLLCLFLVIGLERVTPYVRHSKHVVLMQCNIVQSNGQPRNIAFRLKFIVIITINKL